MKLAYVILSLMLSLNVNAGSLEILNSSEIGTVAHLSHDFGTVWVQQRVSQVFNVRNKGPGTLTFKEAYVYGGDFSARHNCPLNLMPEQRCSFEISYWPMFEGFSSGRFVLEFVEEQLVVDLWGRAQRM